MLEKLDSDMSRLIADIGALRLPGVREQRAEDARQTFRTLIKELHGERQHPIGLDVRDQPVVGRAGAIPTRVYEPAGLQDAALDVVVFIHGGGWIVGDLESCDPTAGTIATQLGVRVVSVDYRRAPEHPFPAALDDCLDVIDAVGHDPWTASISVAGDSAGGNLAAAAAISCRDAAGPPIAAQLLIYPALDPSRTGGSIDRFGDGYLLTKGDMAYFYDCYLPLRHQRELPLASPAVAPTLTGLPPAVVTTAGFDLLRDEGRAYAQRLVDADVPTVYLPFATLTHGWLDMTARVPAAARARDVVLSAFGAALTQR